MRWWIVGFCLYALFCLAIARSVYAHDWYDGDCCHDQDCRPISGIGADGKPWSEIELTADGYVWKSSRSGQEYLFRDGDHLSAGGARIRPSHDGNYHGCESSGAMDGSQWHPPAGLCIYVPLSF